MTSPIYRTIVVSHWSSIGKRPNRYNLLVFLVLCGSAAPTRPRYTIRNELPISDTSGSITSTPRVSGRAAATAKFKPTQWTVFVLHGRRKRSIHSVESAYLYGHRRDRCIRSLNELWRIFSMEILGAAGWAEPTSENVPSSRSARQRRRQKRERRQSLNLRPPLKRSPPEVESIGPTGHVRSFDFFRATPKRLFPAPNCIV
jgi:hypothetical protein